MFGGPDCCEQTAFLVTFGGVPATNVSIPSGGTTIWAHTPPGSGTVDVRVWTFAGPNAPGPGARFTYASP